MRLQQGQVWKKGTNYYRIVEWARLSISYKLMPGPDGGEGTHHTATKKEFCRLIKGAELVPQPAEGETDASQVISPARRTE